MVDCYCTYIVCSSLATQYYVWIFTLAGSLLLAVDGPSPNPKFDAPNKLSSSSLLSNRPPSLATGFFLTEGALELPAGDFCVEIRWNINYQ